MRLGAVNREQIPLMMNRPRQESWSQRTFRPWSATAGGADPHTPTWTFRRPPRGGLEPECGLPSNYAAPILLRLPFIRARRPDTDG